jgi:hypothetical protein
MIDNEEVVHVYQSGEAWCVKPTRAKETSHKRKAVAALHAKQVANSNARGRVIFHRPDGSVEVEKVYSSVDKHQLS